MSLSMLGFRVGRRRNNPSASEDPETTPKPSSTEQTTQPHPSICLSLAPISNRALNPSACFEPGLCSNLPSDHPPLTAVASRMHATRTIVSQQSISCRHLRVVVFTLQSCCPAETYRFPAAFVAPGQASQPPLMFNTRLQQSTVNQCILWCDSVFVS